MGSRAIAKKGDSIMNVAFTKKSSNAKIGAIPCTTSSRNTCPSACPLAGDGGCYAEAGYYTRMHWDKVTDGERGTEYESFLDSIAKLKDGQLWRHNVAGDLQPIADNVIDSDALEALTSANNGKRGFTYTHYPDSAENVAAVRKANENGFTVNLSANSTDDAIRLRKAHGLPVASLVPIDHGNETRVIDGVRFVTCPATYKDGVTCHSCKLCSVSNRDAVIAFPAHGTRANNADIIARG